jgi:hypothetical protein
LLSQYADTYKGICTGDSDRFQRYFWEIESIAFQNSWVFQQSSIDITEQFGGREGILLWENENGKLRDYVVERLGKGRTSAWIRGREAWGREGVVIRIMKHLPVTRYTGELYDNNVAVIIPKDPEHVAAVWSFCESLEFNSQVRRVNQKLSVTDEAFVKVPFDLAHWQDVAAQKFPQGLPCPASDDATQWLFSGRPRNSDQSLHVGVARLLGYRWPRQTGSSFPDCPALGPDGLEKHAEADGIVCLTSLAGKASAANRLRDLLADAYGQGWSASKLAEILSGSESLEVWFRDEFFEEHCEIFHHCPFIWHVWDGRKDGFHALVNYHKLDHKILEKLIYSYLGDWIGRQRQNLAGELEGADGRLAAAEHLQVELKNILDGEKPYDVFARWKCLEEQPLGWNPDLNDGVRINIRPWITQAHLYRATKPGILRITPNIKYGKDRGNEPSRDPKDFPWFKGSTERYNDIHLSLNEKRRARGQE